MGGICGAIFVFTAGNAGGMVNDAEQQAILSLDANNRTLSS